jgi:hypothetical protein
MEQGLIDSAKYKVSLLSLDSRFADQRSCENSEFKMNLPYPLKNVMRIRMASIELSLVEYAFSTDYGNLTCAVRVGAATTFTKVPPISAGNYQADQLCAALEAKLQEVHSDFAVQLNQITGRVTITNMSVPFEFYGVSFNKTIANQKSFWGLGYYLGFRRARIQAEEDPDTNYYFIETESIINVIPNQYYLLQVFAPNAVVNVLHRLDDQGFVEAYAKIILKDGQFTIAFDDNSNLLRKEYTFLAPIEIPFITVKLLNAYGREVNIRDVNWSITFEVTEVTNSRTYTHLSKTYQR